MSENSIIGAKHKKPTYFELFKKVLNELNWREVSSYRTQTNFEPAKCY